jgi:hypothetical protein
MALSWSTILSSLDNDESHAERPLGYVSYRRNCNDHCHNFLPGLRRHGFLTSPIFFPFIRMAPFLPLFSSFLLVTIFLPDFGTGFFLAVR